MVFETWSAGETFQAGYDVGKKASGGEVYALFGQLGTGKTVFAQGFAKGLGIEEIVNSPTFTLVKEYREGRLPFYHFDAYRIEEPEEMEETGFEDCMQARGVVLIEWAERIRQMLPERRIEVVLEKNLEKGFDYRKITVERYF